MLVKNITAEHVFLACDHTDMRKLIDGLAAIVQQNFKLNPFSQDIFMFCGRRKDRIKVLSWDGDGFSLLYKRLDNGKFRWPKDKNEVISISEQQLRWAHGGLGNHPAYQCEKDISHPHNLILYKLPYPLVNAAFARGV